MLSNYSKFILEVLLKMDKSDAIASASRRKSNGSSGATPQYARRVVEQQYIFNDWQITVMKSSILPSNCYCNILDKENTKMLLLEQRHDGEGVESNNGGDQNGTTAKCHVCRLVWTILNCMEQKHFYCNFVWGKNFNTTT